MSLPSKIEQLEEYAAELGMTEEELREFASHYAPKEAQEDEAKSREGLVILHVCDWNLQDRYYEVPEQLVRDLAARLKAEHIDRVWDWFVGQVDYSDNPEKPCKHVTLVDTDLNQWFLDYNDPLTCVKEWEMDWAENA